jgi:S-adenosylmethionine:tRNA ribosyltransferase-isomerase
MEVPEYDLPEAAIAQRPVEPRDAARLLDATGAADPPDAAPDAAPVAAPVAAPDAAGPGTVVHRLVRDLPLLVRRGDVLVLNTTRVMPARLHLTKATGGAAEVLLLEPDPGGGTGVWQALVRPGRRLAPGTVLAVRHSGQATVEVGERLPDGRRRVRLLATPDEVMAACGTVALPPYIHEPLPDPERYQTVYAERPGSVAAPTAGLHLTAAVLERCRQAGAQVCSLDLAVGLATFRPVAGTRVEDHVMHAERYRVPAETMCACQRAGRVIAIGTTTVRALETAAATGELEGESGLFIRPGFEFALVDVLLTNFHLPRSSLLLLLEAFCGPRWRALYREALDRGYRFLSFGDAMIIEKTKRPA